MKLTTKGRYAVTAVLDVALYQKDGLVCLEDISVRQGISQSYLEQLFYKLRRGGVLESLRGPGGGYQVSRSLADITVKEIIDIVDEPVDATQCHGEENCHQGLRCITHHLWSDLTDTIIHFLENVTLEDLVKKSRVNDSIGTEKTIMRWKVSASSSRRENI
jgi:Rrf2 family iron-sulfur cluster assembly transcriptional regulator